MPIAWPVAALIVGEWLQRFAYRTSLDAGVFLISGLVSVVVATSVIAWQVVKAASVNPVKILRCE